MDDTCISKKLPRMLSNGILMLISLHSEWQKKNVHEKTACKTAKLHEKLIAKSHSKFTSLMNQ